MLKDNKEYCPEKGKEEWTVQSIISTFFPNQPSKDFCYYDLCDYNVNTISLPLTNFYSSNPTIENILKDTDFYYTGCNGDIKSPSFNLQYIPFSRATLLPDGECSNQEQPQESYLTQLTVPTNYAPGSPLVLNLSLVLLPSIEFARAFSRQHNITGKPGDKIKIDCPPPVVSALAVTADSIHQCDKRIQGGKDAFRLKARSCDFSIYDHDLVEQSIKKIQVQIIIKPNKNDDILPQDLLVLQLFRVWPTVGSDDSRVEYGLLNATLSYKSVPLTLEDVVYKLDACEQLSDDIDAYLNTYTSDNCDSIAKSGIGVAKQSIISNDDPIPISDNVTTSTTYRKSATTVESKQPINESKKMGTSCGCKKRH